MDHRDHGTVGRVRGHTDKNGKISKKEFMAFMEAEFERLDKDKSGELDAKELTHSKLRVSHFANERK
jgi:Ca2+-binding EF-hand superfamily protein